MIKGINHQVVEITRPSCEYFERVLFFVKPEYATVSDGKIRERATRIAVSTGSPPATRGKRRKAGKILSPVFWSLIGAAVCAVIIKGFGL